MTPSRKHPRSTVARRRTLMFCTASVLALAAGGPAAAQTLSGLRGAVGATSNAAATPGGSPNSTFNAIRAVTPAQAQQRTQQTTSDLNRALAALKAQLNAQATAGAAAASAPGAVPDGLRVGGLLPASGAGTDPTLWQNANLPVQRVASGETTVAILQTAPRAVLSWDSFNIGDHTTLDFIQRDPSGAAQPGWVALNRILDTATLPSQILGSIHADGQVYVINRNGIIFGGASQVGVHSLVATSLQIYPGAANDALRFSATGGFTDPKAGGLFGSALGALSTGDQSTFGTAFDSATGSADGALEGAVMVEAGATITSTGTPDKPGFILLAAPTVVNAGSLASPNGQVALIGSRSVTLSQTNPGLPNNTLSIAIGTNPNSFYQPQGLEGSVTNSGLVTATDGTVNLAANSISQSGVIQVTTGISTKGSITLNATQTVAALGRALDGNVTFTADSVTSVQPDGSSQVLPLGQTPPGGAINVTGRVVDLASNSLISAPGATVTINAASSIDALALEQSAIDGSSPPVLGARVFLDAGAAIDVGGIPDYQVPASATTITFAPRGQEFANSPLQRQGDLRGQTLTADGNVFGTRPDGVNYVGTPLADLSGYLTLNGQTIAQLSTVGGTVNLSSDYDVITRPGSVINVSGGYIDHLAGTVNPTVLLTADGRRVSLSNADPNQQYVGIANDFTVNHPRWAISQTYANELVGNSQIQPAYVEGRAGGALNLKIGVPGDPSQIANLPPPAPTFLLGGAIVADTLTGPLQTARSSNPFAARQNPPAGAQFSLTSFTASIFAQSGAVAQDAGLTVDSAKIPAFTPPPELTNAASIIGGNETWVALPTDALSAMGLGAIALSSGNEEVIVAPGATLRARPGGGITLFAQSINIYGDLTAPAGSITATAVQGGLGGGAYVPPLFFALNRTHLLIDSAATLSTRGLWVDDRASDTAPLGDAFINGGAISLTSQTIPALTAVFDPTPDTTPVLDLRPGSVLDVSSGGRILPNGQLELVKVNRALGANDPSQRAAGLVPAGKAGSISLSSSSPPPLATPPPPFVVGGFANLGSTLLASGFADGGRLSVTAPYIRIATDPDPAAPYALLFTPAFFHDSPFSGVSLTSNYGFSIGANEALAPRQTNFLRDARLFSLPTGGDIYRASPVGVLPDYVRTAADLTIDSVFAPPPLTSLPLAFSSHFSISADPGAALNISAYGMISVGGTLTAPGGSITLASAVGLALDPTSRLDVRGVSLLDPYAPVADGRSAPLRTGVVLNGGTINLEASIGVANGATIDIGGASDIFDFKTAALAVGSLGAAIATLPVWSNGGSLNISAPFGTIDGAIHAAAGDPRGIGGRIAIGQTTIPFGELVVTPDNAGQAFSSAQGGVYGGALFVSTATLNASQAADVSLSATDNFATSGIVFSGSSTLTASRSIVVDSYNVSAIPDLMPAASAVVQPASINLTAPYVSLGDSGSLQNRSPAVQAPYAAPTLSAPQAGDGAFTVDAKLIDFTGGVALSGVRDAVFNSSGDIRFVPTPVGRYYLIVNGDTGSIDNLPIGELLTAGNLTFHSAQAYPTTGADFTIKSFQTDASGNVVPTTISFTGTGAAATSPLSAGAKLTVDATDIVLGPQAALRVPGGDLVLGLRGASGLDPYDPSGDASGNPFAAPTASVTFSPSSLASVSLGGQSVPYGVTRDTVDWFYFGTPVLSSPTPLPLTQVLQPPQKSIAVTATSIDLGIGSKVDLSGGGSLYAQEWIPGTGGSRDVLATVQPNGTPTYADGRAVYAIVPGVQPLAAPIDFQTLGSGGVAPQVGMAVRLDAAPGIAAGDYTLLPAAYATLPGAFRLVEAPQSSTPAIGTYSVERDGSIFVTGTYSSALGGGTSTPTLFELQSGPVWKQYSQYNIADATTYFTTRANLSGASAPQLPVDAGRLVVSALNQLTFGSTFDFSPAQGGRGGLADITAAQIAVVNDAQSAPSGYLALDATQLSNIGASSLLIGGTRSQTVTGFIITPSATDIFVGTSAANPLAVNDLILAVAPTGGGGLTIDSGSVITSAGSVTLTSGTISIGDAVTLSATTTLSIAADLSATIAPTTTFRAPSIDLRGQDITFDALGGARGGIVIGSAALTTLQNAQSLAFHASDQINFIGAQTLRLAGASSLIELDTPTLVGDGALDVSANHVLIDNTTGFVPATRGTGGSTLTLDGANVEFGAGSKALGGFGTVVVDATGQLTGSGSGSLALGGSDLTITTPLAVASSQSLQSFTTSGRISVTASGSPAAPAASTQFGGQLDLIGGAVDFNTTFLSPAGSLKLEATSGDVVIGAASILATPAFAKQFFDQQRFSSGGSISLLADMGNVLASPGSKIDVSGLGNADAGSIVVRAPLGTASLNGTLTGGAATGQTGASLTIDSQTPIDLNGLAASLAAGHVNGDLAFRSVTGDLVLDGMLTGRSISLTADAGTVTVNGAIDASGAAGGKIGLFGDRGVTLAGKLTAVGTDPGQRGGDITLDTAAFAVNGIVTGGGFVRVEAGAVIDVSGGSRGGLSGGTVNVRAPYLAGDVAVTLDGTFKGARSVSLEGFQSWYAGQSYADPVAGTTTPVVAFDGIVDAAGFFGADGRRVDGSFYTQLQDGTGNPNPTPVAYFVGGAIVDASGNLLINPTTGIAYAAPDQSWIFDPGRYSAGRFVDYANQTHINFATHILPAYFAVDYSAIESRFSNIANFVYRPGVELVNTGAGGVNGGNLTLASNLNLAASRGAATDRNAPAPGLIFRTASGHAGVWTFRAVGNIELNASISDAFANFNADAAHPAFVDPNGIIGSVDRIAVQHGNAIANTPSLALFDPVLRADQFSSRWGDTSSYVFTASADPVSANPATSRPGSGDIVINGHQQVTLQVPTTSCCDVNGNTITALAAVGAYVIPTVVRTGGGSITLTAGRDIVFADQAGPGVIYAAGRPNESVYADNLKIVPVVDGGGNQVYDPTGFFPQFNTVNSAGQVDTTGFVFPDVGTVRSTSLGFTVPLTAPVYPEAGGDVTLNAGRDIVGVQNVQNAGEYSGQLWNPWLLTRGRSNYTQAVGIFNPSDTFFEYISFPGFFFSLPANEYPLQTTSWINWGGFAQGVLSAGGNVSANAGGNIRDLSISLPQTSWTSGGLADNSTGAAQGVTEPVTHLVGGGNLSVQAGGDLLSGSYYVGSGAGAIRVGGSVKADWVLGVDRVSTILGIQDSTIAVSAAGGIDIGRILNPTYVGGAPASVFGSDATDPINGFDPSIGRASYVTFSPTSSVSLIAASGDIVFNTISQPAQLFAYGSNDLTDVNLYVPETRRYFALDEQLFKLAPPTLNAVALTGSISVARDMSFYPSPSGTLTLVAGGDVRLSATNYASPLTSAADAIAATNGFESRAPSLVQLDIAPINLPSPLDPLSVLPRSGETGAPGVARYNPPSSTATLAIPPELPQQPFNTAFHADGSAPLAYFSSLAYVAGSQLPFFATVPTHLEDPTPNTIYALGSIVDGVGNPATSPLDLTQLQQPLLVALAKQSDIHAGRDIVDLTLFGQNNRPGDVTSVIAAGNIYSATTTLIGGGGSAIYVSGPGLIDVEAGGNLGPFLPLAGIEAVGQNINPNVAAGHADVIADFGVAPGISYDAISAKFLDPASPDAAPYQAPLIAFVDAFAASQSGGSGAGGGTTSASDAYAIFKTLRPAHRKLLVERVFFDQLLRGVTDAPPKYSVGYQAIETLFPSSAGYTQNNLGTGTLGAIKTVVTGNFDLRNSTVQTEAGGDIYILGPGGGFTVGSLSAPTAGTPLQRQGILTLEGGAIRSFTDGSVDVNQSRVFTENSGDIELWSANGNLDAGRGSKTNSALPPVTFKCDLDAFCTLDLAQLVTGAGIATFALPGLPGGDVYLVAPAGIVDAGDAGIRVAGNLVIAAQQVANADNVTVTGAISGIPAAQTTNLALATTDTATKEATKVAQDLTRDRSRHEYTVTVEVTGFGGDDNSCSDPATRSRECPKTW